MQELNDKKIILVVDDNEFYHNAAKTILADEYEIITAKSGQEAVEFLLQGNTPNLILLDIVMPDMDGWATYRRLRNIDSIKNVPVIFVTSVSGESEFKHAQDVGIADFITKPYKMDDLLDRIQKAINKH